VARPASVEAAGETMAMIAKRWGGVAARMMTNDP
jgi:hypothetical protein